MTLFGQTEPDSAPSLVQTPHQVDPVKNYCQRLSAVLNLAMDSDRQLLQAMQEFRRTWPDRFREVAWVDLSFLIDLPHFDDDSSRSASSRKRKCHLHLPSPLRSVKRSCSRSSKRQQAAQTKPSQVCQSAVDGVSKLMCHLMENERYRTEGIFRKTGNCGRQKELRRQLMQSQCSSAECSLAGYTVHDIASVVKLLLRGLEDPIVSDRLIELLVAITDLNSADKASGRTESESHLARCRQLHALRIFGQLMPEANMALLSSVLHLLHTVANSPETKMTFDSLGTVFGPVLFCGKSNEATSLQKVERLNRISAFLIANCYQLSMIPRSFAEKLARQSTAVLSANAAAEDFSSSPAAAAARFCTVASASYSSPATRRIPFAPPPPQPPQQQQQPQVAPGGDQAMRCYQQHPGRMLQLASLQKHLRLRRGSCARVRLQGLRRASSNTSPRPAGHLCDFTAAAAAAGVMSPTSHRRPRLVRALSSLRLHSRDTRQAGSVVGVGEYLDDVDAGVRVRLCFDALKDDEESADLQPPAPAPAFNRPPTPSSARRCPPRLRGSGSSVLDNGSSGVSAPKRLLLLRTPSQSLPRSGRRSRSCRVPTAAVVATSAPDAAAAASGRAPRFLETAL